MRYRLFLGGTSGKHPWRDAFTEDLKREGVNPECIFNPIVPDWGPAAQKREDEVKGTCQFRMFYIGRPGIEPSIYTPFEALLSLVDRPKNTVVVIDLGNHTGHAYAAYEKIYRDLKRKFPRAPIFTTLNDALKWLTPRLLKAQSENR